MSTNVDFHAAANAGDWGRAELLARLALEDGQRLSADQRACLAAGRVDSSHVRARAHRRGMPPLISHAKHNFFANRGSLNVVDS